MDYKILILRFLKFLSFIGPIGMIAILLFVPGAGFIHAKLFFAFSILSAIIRVVLKNYFEWGIKQHSI